VAAPVNRPPRYWRRVIGVERMIGPKPVSSSRTTTLATKAVVTNMKNKLRLAWIRVKATGLFLWMLPPAPIRTPLEAIAPKVNSRNITAATQKTGFLIW